MNESFIEFISPSGKYKSIITERSDCFLIDLYILSEDFDPNTEQTYGQYWSRKNMVPVIVDKGFSAEAFAIDELRNFMGEPDLPLTIEWIRDFSFCKVARFLNPQEVKVFCELVNSESQQRRMEAIDVKTIIDFAGLCLVEEIGEEDDWQMWQLDSDGSIYCWGNYGSLREAIKAL